MQNLSGIPTDLVEAEISGVKEAFAELEEAGAVDPVVKATLAVSESGFAGIQDAVAYGEIKESLTGMPGRSFSLETKQWTADSISQERSKTSLAVARMAPRGRRPNRAPSRALQALPRIP